jgi:hypothetical protein
MSEALEPAARLSDQPNPTAAGPLLLFETLLEEYLTHRRDETDPGRLNSGTRGNPGSATRISMSSNDSARRHARKSQKKRMIPSGPN